MIGTDGNLSAQIGDLQQKKALYGCNVKSENCNTFALSANRWVKVFETLNIFFMDFTDLFLNNLKMLQ
jgi:hypothetical protein